MVHHLSAFSDRFFEEIVKTGELGDSTMTFELRGEAGPHVGHYDDVPEGGVSTQLSEDTKVGFGKAADTGVGNTVNVDDSVEGLAFTVSGRRK